MIKVAEIARTCYACPSQWDGKTSSGKAVYIRYRWGVLAVHVAKTDDTSEFAALDGDCVFCTQIGDNFDGMLEYKDLKEVLEASGVASLPETSVGEEDATYERAAELFAIASERLTKMIDEGTIQVVDGLEKLPRHTWVFTGDKESKESLMRRGYQVQDKVNRDDS